MTTTNTKDNAIQHRKSRWGIVLSFVLGVTIIPASAMYYDMYVTQGTAGTLIDALAFLKGQLYDTIYKSAVKTTERKIKEEERKAKEKLKFESSKSNMKSSDFNAIDNSVGARSASAASLGLATNKFIEGSSTGSMQNKTGQSVAPSAVPAKLAAGVRQSQTANAKVSCGPLDALPIDKSGTEVSCTANDALLRGITSVGVDVMPPLSAQQAETEAGSIYEALRVKTIQQRSTASMTVGSVDHPETQKFISAIRALNAKPSLEELEKQTAQGGADRDKLVISQVRTRLLAELTIEQMEVKRLQAMRLSNSLDQENLRMVALRQRVMSGN